MIGLIFINDLIVCPYIDKYISELEKNNEDYEIIIWDRQFYKGKKYNYKNVEVFDLKAEEGENYIGKLFHFYKYSRFLSKKIESKKYDKLIVLSTLSGFVCYRKLIKKYKGKYIFDYRDASFERISIFSNLLSKIIKNSFFTCISSPGFKSILPKHDYIMAHNFKYDDYLNNKIENAKKTNKKPIIVSLVGVMREFDFSKKLIDIFGNDERFELRFHGSGPSFNETMEYSKEFNNVLLTGKYESNEKYKYIEQSDMLLYNYPCGFNRDIALANKFYDSIIYKKPLIANLDTFSGKLVQESGLGISVSFKDSKETYKDKIIKYYENFDEKVFDKNANKKLNEILVEDKIYLDKIEEFIKA